MTVATVLLELSEVLVDAPPPDWIILIVRHSPAEKCPGRPVSLMNPDRRVDMEAYQPGVINVFKVFKVIKFIKGWKVINVINVIKVKVHLEAKVWLIVWEGENWGTSWLQAERQGTPFEKMRSSMKKISWQKHGMSFIWLEKDWMNNPYLCTIFRFAAWVISVGSGSAIVSDLWCLQKQASKFNIIQVRDSAKSVTGVEWRATRIGIKLQSDVLDQKIMLMWWWWGLNICNCEGTLP